MIPAPRRDRSAPAETPADDHIQNRTEQNPADDERRRQNGVMRLERSGQHEVLSFPRSEIPNPPRSVRASAAGPAF